MENDAGSQDTASDVTSVSRDKTDKGVVMNVRFKDISKKEKKKKKRKKRTVACLNIFVRC